MVGAGVGWLLTCKNAVFPAETHTIAQHAASRANPFMARSRLCLIQERARKSASWGIGEWGNLPGFRGGRSPPISREPRPGVIEPAGPAVELGLLFSDLSTEVEHHVLDERVLPLLVGERLVPDPAPPGGAPPL